MNMTISAVVLTKNEEINIKACLKSISFCNEIIIIDDNSTDRTLEKVKKAKVTIFKSSLNEDFSHQLNFGLEKAKGDWILFLDPDERISKVLKEEILNFIRPDNLKYDGMIFKRIDYIWGRWLKHGEVGAFRAIRLVRKGQGKWKRRVHQTLDVQGQAFQAHNPILHYPHKSLGKFVENINKWSTLHAKANMEEGKKSTVLKILIYPLMHFVRNYIIRLGFLDGMQGFVVALIMASHSYLSWSKQWMLKKGFSKI